MSKQKDYYQILGVSENATTDEIKKAYRRLAREHHPDVNSGNKESEDLFKEINEAYQVLSDPDKRRIYDRYGQAGFDPSHGFHTSGGMGDFGGFGDIFDLFFGGGTQTQRYANAPEKGQDRRVDVEITLEEAFTGVKKEIKYTKLDYCDTCKGTGAEDGSVLESCPVCKGHGQVRQQQQSIFGTQIRITTCPNCGGTGQINRHPCKSCDGHGRGRRTVTMSVDIPAGIDSGMRIRLPKQGDAGINSGPYGDLYVVVHVKQHNFFERKGNDLWCEVPISFALAALGGTIKVKTIDGEEELNVHPGTQFGEVYTLRGKGMPDPQRHTNGHLNVMLKVMTPTNLTSEEKELLKKFADIRGETIEDGHGRSFFERVKDALNGL
ncbi:MAG: molecular chaperone DnaJ [Armatimonadota bacterium]